MSKMKLEIVTTSNHGNVLVEMPVEYDPSLVADEDILEDGMLRLVRYVEGGDIHEDYDHGQVVEVDAAARTVTVAWACGQTTSQNVNQLRAYGCLGPEGAAS